MSTLVNDTLSSIDLFADLSKRELKAVGKMLTPATIAAGKEFITEGAVGREAYIIVSGDASVWKRGKLITTVGPGTVLGEMAVLTGVARTATVRAETDLEVEVLMRREFLTLLDQSPTITRKLLVSTIQRLQEMAPDLLS